MSELSLQKICVSFNERQVLHEISCALKLGDVVALLGSNGAGKSTLLDVISGKIKPQRGQILFAGKKITPLSERQRAVDIGRLFQNTNVGTSPSLTVRDNLVLANLKGKAPRLGLKARRFNDLEAHELATEAGLDLPAILDVPVSLLSGGQRQMIAFLMVILTQPKILLLDEPTAALSPEASLALMKLMSRFVRETKTPTLYITHDLGLIADLSTKVWTMKDGKLEGS